MVSGHKITHSLAKQKLPKISAPVLTAFSKVNDQSQPKFKNSDQ
jgi:hypothetical protein